MELSCRALVYQVEDLEFHPQHKYKQGKENQLVTVHAVRLVTGVHLVTGNPLCGFEMLNGVLCDLQGEPSEESSLGALHVHLQPFDMRKVGVVFTPADYGKVTSLILIR